MWNDNWTVVTADGGLSAQFEHSLLITESGVEILTVWDNMESSGALYSGGFMISFVPISKFGGGTCNCFSFFIANWRM